MTLTRLRIRSGLRLRLANGLRRPAIAIALSLCSHGAALHAQEAPPTHQCKAPTIPNEITDQASADRVQSQVNTFKQCVQDFVSAQQALAERHSKAANAAVADYNEFVTTKLPTKAK